MLKITSAARLQLYTISKGYVGKNMNSPSSCLFVPLFIGVLGRTDYRGRCNRFPSCNPVTKINANTMWKNAQESVSIIMSFAIASLLANCLVLRADNATVALYFYVVSFSIDQITRYAFIQLIDGQMRPLDYEVHGR